MEVKNYDRIGEKVYVDTLPNGLALFCVPKPGYQKKYAYFATNYGGADRRFKLSGKWIDTPMGVAHFLEHKLFDIEGGGNALTNLSANGASPNAYTSTDITAYHFECVDKFYDNLRILLSFVSTPYFTPESVEKEKGIIGQEIAMVEDDPDYSLYYGLLKSLFSHNPMRDSVAGTIESISQITADTLYDCHKAFYAPSNMALCVVGDIDPSQVLALAKEILPTDKSEIPTRDYGAIESPTPHVTGFFKEMEVSLPIFLAGCKVSAAPVGIDYLRHELTGSIALDILAGHSSPLYLDMYAKGIVNSDFAASYDSSAGAAYVMFGGEARDPKLVYDRVLNEISTLTRNGIDLEFFQRIKKAALGFTIRAFNSFESISGNIIGGHFKGFDPFDAPDVVAAITPDDIVNFYKNQLDPSNMAMSIISPVEAEEGA